MKFHSIILQVSLLCPIFSGTNGRLQGAAKETTRAGDDEKSVSLVTGKSRILSAFDDRTCDVEVKLEDFRLVRVDGNQFWRNTEWEDFSRALSNTPVQDFQFSPRNPEFVSYAVLNEVKRTNLDFSDVKVSFHNTNLRLWRSEELVYSCDGCAPNSAVFNLVIGGDMILLTKNGDSLLTKTTNPTQAQQYYAGVYMYDVDSSIEAVGCETNFFFSLEWDHSASVMSSDLLHIKEDLGTLTYDGSWSKTKNRVSKVEFSAGDTTKYKRVVLTKSDPGSDYPDESEIVAMVGLFRHNIIQLEPPFDSQWGDYGPRRFEGYSTGDEFLLVIENDSTVVNFYWNGAIYYSFDNPSRDMLYASVWLYNPGACVLAAASTPVVPGVAEPYVYPEQEILQQETAGVFVKRMGYFDVPFIIEKNGGTDGAYDAYMKFNQPVRRVYFSAGEAEKYKMLILSKTVAGSEYPKYPDRVVQIGFMPYSTLRIAPNTADYANAYTTDDEFMLDIKDSRVDFYRNGILFQSFPKEAGSDLFPSAWFYNMGSKMNVRAIAK